MVTLRPFKALRPDEKYVDRVAALPYDTMNTQEARIMAQGNPYILTKSMPRQART